MSARLPRVSRDSDIITNSLMEPPHDERAHFGVEDLMTVEPALPLTPVSFPKSHVPMPETSGCQSLHATSNLVAPSAARQAAELNPLRKAARSALLEEIGLHRGKSGHFRHWVPNLFCLQAYFRNRPVTAATSFVTRPLRLNLKLRGNGVFSARQEHDRGVCAQAA